MTKQELLLHEHSKKEKDIESMTTNMFKAFIKSMKPVSLKDVAFQFEMSNEVDTYHVAYVSNKGFTLIKNDEVDEAFLEKNNKILFIYYFEEFTNKVFKSLGSTFTFNDLYNNKSVKRYLGGLHKIKFLGASNPCMVQTDIEYKNKCWTIYCYDMNGEISRDIYPCKHPSHEDYEELVKLIGDKIWIDNIDDIITKEEFKRHIRSYLIPLGYASNDIQYGWYLKYLYKDKIIYVYVENKGLRRIKNIDDEGTKDEACFLVSKDSYDSIEKTPMGIEVAQFSSMNANNLEKYLLDRLAII
jgi:hypothetical protein